MGAAVRVAQEAHGAVHWGGAAHGVPHGAVQEAARAGGTWVAHGAAQGGTGVANRAAHT